ncbi:hypothetical protein F511_45558 [Dorcoceras hygrometricum]|uniref:Uncharacterized protein n=1 Tax=Dorcoceras hygrometricum TaxID=472368 RepID=A0A2Z6ZW65_9LAMI|nr:hypothetical protein F511_45558 [Dorcoceras hygrometricum]
MTSAYLLEEAMSSKDYVSSKLQYIQQSTRSTRAGSAMMKSAVTSAISRELQCYQQLVLERLIYEKNTIEEVAVRVVVAQKILNQKKTTIKVKMNLKRSCQLSFVEKLIGVDS